MATSEPVREKGVHLAILFLCIWNGNADVSAGSWVGYYMFGSSELWRIRGSDIWVKRLGAQADPQLGLASAS